MKQIHLIVAFFLLGIVLVTGCGSNPILSQPAYQKAIAVFSAIGRKDLATLSKLRELITKSKAESEISANEADLLLAVIDNAKDGNWESASARMRKLMDKQVVAARLDSNPGQTPQRHRH